jgi:hypothetical protein
MFFIWALAYCGNEERLVFLYILVKSLMFKSELAFQNEHCVTVHILLRNCLMNMPSFISYVSSELDCPFYQLLPRF